MATASPYGRGLVGLLKRGWNEIPGVMGSIVLGIVGTAMGTVGTINYLKDRSIPSHKFKYNYVVVRPDDPLAQKLKKN